MERGIDIDNAGTNTNSGMSNIINSGYVHDITNNTKNITFNLIMVGSKEEDINALIEKLELRLRELPVKIY